MNMAPGDATSGGRYIVMGSMSGYSYVMDSATRDEVARFRRREDAEARCDELNGRPAAGEAS